MRAPCAGVVSFALLLAVPPLRAQEPRLPPDSLEIGRQYVEWFLTGQGDSLYARMVPDFQEVVGSPWSVAEQSIELHRRAGSRVRVVEERYVTRNGKPQFWHTAEFTDFEEPVQIRFVIEPDGRISGVGMNPLSQAPPTDN